MALNLGEAPSRPRWGHSRDLAISAGDILGGDGVFYCQLLLARLEFSVPNKVDIDCVVGNFTQLLNIT